MPAARRALGWTALTRTRHRGDPPAHARLPGHSLLTRYHRPQQSASGGPIRVGPRERQDRPRVGAHRVPPVPRQHLSPVAGLPGPGGAARRTSWASRGTRRVLAECDGRTVPGMREGSTLREHGLAARRHQKISPPSFQPHCVHRTPAYKSSREWSTSLHPSSFELGAPHLRQPTATPYPWKYW